MTWFRIDDGFHGHPKVVELSLEAVGLWALAGSWCAQYLTDGLVSARTVRRFGASDEATTELVDADLWIEVEDGWLFKDWSDYQPMKEEVEAERSAARERMKRVRAKKKGVTSPDVRPNDLGTTSGRSPDGSEEVRVTPPDQLPPTSSSTSNEVETPLTPQGGKRPKSKGTRLDPDWMPSQGLIDQMRSECPGVDLEPEHRVFVDYWIAQPGQKGVKLDWPATWRNWMRRKQSDQNSRPKRLTPTERAQETAAAGRRVGGMQITTLSLEEA